MPEEKPLLTFMLIAYNQERFIAEAVQGAFSQTYTPLEIILSDDCSPDHTFEIMQAMAAEYHGPHTIVLNRNERNLGLIGHINHVMEFAKGELIVAAAGDDISMPERSERLCETYLASERKAYSIFSNGIWIDSNSRQLNPLRKKPVKIDELSLENYAVREMPGFINGCTHAWQRDDFTFFGPLPEDVEAEDTTIPFRSALLGKIIYIHEPLVYYRRDINRFRDSKKMIGFTKYTETMRKQKIAFLVMYRSRLKDIELIMSKNKITNDAHFVAARQLTVNQISRLENTQYRSINMLWNYIKINIYFQYQDFWRFIHKSRLRM